MKNITANFFIFITIFIFDVNSSIAQKTMQEKVDSLVSVLKSAKEDTTKVNTLNGVAYEFRNNDPDTAIYFATQALTLGTKLSFKYGIANAHSYTGIAKKNLGDFEGALTEQFLSLKFFNEIGLEKGVAKSYQNIGNIYLSQGNYPLALKNDLACLGIFEKLGNKKGIADSHINIGIIYKNQENYSEAMKNYEASLKISEEIGDKGDISAAYSSMAVIDIVRENYESALKHQLASLAIEKEIENKKGIAFCYNNIGINYYSQGKYAEALKNYFSSLAIKEEIKDKIGVISTLANIGNIYTKQKHFHEADTYLNKGLAIAKETNNLEQLRDIYLHLEELDSVQGNFGNAYKTLKSALYFENQLMNKENTKKTVQIQMQYDYDKKVAAAKFVQDKKDALAKAEAERQVIIHNSIFGGFGLIGVFSFFMVRSFNKRKKSIFEKQVSEVEMTALRSQMNPHFIFNSLHSINNYMMNNDKRNASDYLGKFSKLMRLILENSREQDVPLEKDLLTLQLYMELEAMRFENRFSYKIDVADDIDKENTLVPPMILQPFVENSILHGLQHKESEGRITIKIRKDNDMLVCMVEDNGVGRQKALEMKDTTANHKGASLGMKITNARIDIINKLKKAKASVNLIDLKEGMRAEVILPYELVF